MKRLFSVKDNTSAVDVALLIARVGIGALMLVHGLPKMVALFSGDPVQFPSIMGMSAGLSLALAVFAEVVCSILLIVGFGTRLASVPLIITMVIAVFIIHGADPFAKQEMALHYLLVYIVLLFTGSGKYSVDYTLHKKTQPLVVNTSSVRKVA